MEFRKTGTGKSLYWCTVPLTFKTPSGASVSGVYLLDTGGKAIISRQSLGPSTGFPQTVTYGSGTVAGYKQENVTIERIGSRGETARNVTVLHRCFAWPFHDSIDGILGLCPGSDITGDWGLRSVEFDFRASTVYLGVGPVRQPKIFPGKCQTNRHWMYPQRPWLRSSMTLVDTENQRKSFEDVWIFCDTGATKALTFFTRVMTKIPVCKDKPKLSQIVLHDVGKGGSGVRLAVPVDSYWPVCVPTLGGDHLVHSVIMGIQALDSLTSFSYDITDHEEVVRVCMLSR